MSAYDMCTRVVVVQLKIPLVDQSQTFQNGDSLRTAARIRALAEGWTRGIELCNPLDEGV